MKFKTWISKRWICLDYGFILPILARLPMRWGRFLASLRGMLYAKVQRDWRQFSFNDTSLHERTCEAFEKIVPGIERHKLEHIIRDRYRMQSLEEFDAACLVRNTITRWPVVFDGLEAVEEAAKTGQGIVFLTAHFGTSIVGGPFLRRLGLPILGMSSDIVDHPQVDPNISRFFQLKYQAMGNDLNGGTILHRQGNTRRFLRILQQGGAVVIVGDLPPDPGEEAIFKPFFGENRGFSPGAVKMAAMTKSLLFAYVCEFIEGQYVIRFSKPGEDVYGFIESAIKNNPCAWWAADLLPLLPLESPVDVTLK